MLVSIVKKFTRRKIIDKNSTDTQLHRVLSTLDLTLLGIGSTLGIGIYVLAGSVAKSNAGPGVVLSFFVAAFASVLAGLCYAEFGARVPKAGSAYVYSYVCVGELIAFIVGWNLIMEYVIGVASVARGYSGYVDSLLSERMSHAFRDFIPIDIPHLSPYVDFFALGITLVLTFILAFGVKESSLFNNVFTVLNLVVVLFVIVAGSIYADPKNWALSVDDINKLLANDTVHNITAVDIGAGGFAPFGFSGIMKGAATCFYGFVGFDCIATTGEEAKNPQRAIPLAIIFSLLFIFIAYSGISAVITMMVPYFLQDAHAPLPAAFTSVGFTVGTWFCTIGALFGLSTSLLGCMFPMPRVIYAMASDGVLFKFLAKVHPRFQTPLIATILGGSFGGLMAALFELEALIDMMSIGTLTAYTLVAVCVLCLRYRKDVDGADDINESCVFDESLTIRKFMVQFFNCKRLKVPNALSSSFTNWNVVIYCGLVCCFCAVAIFWEENILNKEVGSIIVLSVLGLAMVFLLISLTCQPVSRVNLTFKVPLVPLIPGISILINVYLIMKLSGATWVRFAVWMGIGFLFYGYCLFSGTTDSSYNAQLDDKNKRKYSKISVAEIGNLSMTPVRLSNGKPKIDSNGKETESNGNTIHMTSVENSNHVSVVNGTHALNQDSNINEHVQKSAADNVKNETSSLITAGGSNANNKKEESFNAAKDCIDSIMSLAHMHSVAQNSLKNNKTENLTPIVHSETERKNIQVENIRMRKNIPPTPTATESSKATLDTGAMKEKMLTIHNQAQEVLKNLHGESKGAKVTLTTLVLESTPAPEVVTSSLNTDEAPNAVIEHHKDEHHVPASDIQMDMTLGHGAVDSYTKTGGKILLETFRTVSPNLLNAEKESIQGKNDLESEVLGEQTIPNVHPVDKNESVPEDLMQFQENEKPNDAPKELVEHSTKIKTPSEMECELTLSELEKIVEEVEGYESIPSLPDEVPNTSSNANVEEDSIIENKKKLITGEVEELVVNTGSEQNNLESRTAQLDQGKTL